MRLEDLFMQFFITRAGSVFKSGWLDCPSEWHQPQLAAEFDAIRSLRSLTYKVLSSAREAGSVRGFTEAEVEIVTDSEELFVLLQRYAGYSRRGRNREEENKSENSNYSLSDIFIVSRVSVELSDSVGSEGRGRDEVRVYSDEGCVEWGGEECRVSVRVWRAEEKGHYKCPRCWLWTASSSDQLCQRCRDVEDEK